MFGKIPKKLSILDNAKLAVANFFTANNTFSRLVFFASGANIASAATIDLTAATGNTVNITGTTTTTAITITAGQQMMLIAQAAWPLTHHATNLNLPGGVNYTCAAGDRILVIKDLAGVVYVSIWKADGTAVVGSGSKLQSVTATQASGALTVGTNPTSLDFRSATLTTGVPVPRTLSSSATLVIPSGATLGISTGTSGRLVTGLLDNAGTLEEFAVNIAGGVNLDETTLISTTAISAGATSASVIYSTTARTNVPFRVTSIVDAVNTAGAYSNPTAIQPIGGNALLALQAKNPLYYRLETGVVGANVTTAQNIFGAGVTLQANTVYKFKIKVSYQKTAGITAHNMQFLLGGTATFNNFEYWLKGSGAGTSAVPFTPVNTANTIEGFSNITTVVTSSATFAAAALIVENDIEGTFSVNAGGTFIPQYQLTVAPGGAYTTMIGSFVEITPIGIAGANSQNGAWA